MNLINLPEETTEVQAIVIELRQGQRKNALKFGVFMVLLFAVVGLLFGLVGSISANSAAVQGVIGILNGVQEPRN